MVREKCSGAGQQRIGAGLAELRRRYPRLDIASWSRENRLQI